MSYGNKPRNRKSDPSSGASKSAAKHNFSDFRFVRIELREEHKERFRSLLDSGEFRDLSVDDYIALGYKVSFSGSNEGKTVVCSFSASSPEHGNAGLVLTSRAADSVTALAVNAFKDIYLCMDGLWRTGENAGGGDANDIG